MYLFHNAPAQPSLRRRLHTLRHWFDTEPGQQMLTQQLQVMEGILCTSFGHFAAQLSVCNQLNLLAATRVRRQVALHWGEDALPTEGSALQVDGEHWPFRPGGLDLVLLQHSLELSDTPHRLLSEAANALILGGKLVIIGFNPYSVLALHRLCAPVSRAQFSGVDFISPRRLKDWLKLLNFEVKSIHYGGYTQPWELAALERRLDHKQLPVGGFFVLEAIREELGITPIRRVWSEQQRRLVGQPITRPVGRATRRSS